MQTIQLYNLSIGYGKHAVVSDINATLNSGRLTCLLGRNGVGKSTLLRTLAGFTPPIAGEIYIQGTPLERLSHHELAEKISVVLTERMDIRNLTAIELVGLGRTPYTGFWGVLSDEDHKIVSNAMQLVGIEQLAERNISSLSDGERQKVMMAKALAQQTPIIILDEPTAFLDFQSKVDTLRLLAQLAHELDKTVFLSTHDIEQALQITDAIWLLDDQRKLHTGTTTQLIENGTLHHFIESEHIRFDADDRVVRLQK